MSCAVDESVCIFPPRPTAAIPFETGAEFYCDFGWVAQLKYNDTRCLIKYLADGGFELWNRHGMQIRNYTPSEELAESLGKLPKILGLGSGWHLLDGGLLDQKHRAIKDTVVVWDVLVRGGEHLIGSTYGERYFSLLAGSGRKQEHWLSEFGGFNFSHPLQCPDQYVLGEFLCDGVFMPRLIYPLDWRLAWSMVQRFNEPFLEAGCGPVIEGVVWKDLDGVLEAGWREKNNGSWLSRSRVVTSRHNF